MKTVGDVQTWESRIGNRTANETASGEIIDLDVKPNSVTPLRHVIYRNPVLSSILLSLKHVSFLVTLKLNDVQCFLQFRDRINFSRINFK